MSSKHVRDSVKSFMDSGLASVSVVDISGAFEDIKRFLSDEGIGLEDPWYGIQYLPSEDVPITVGSTNNQGKYREIGAIFIHIVEPATKNARDNIVDRGETIRDLFRGERIANDIVVEGVVPVNFEAAATLQFESGFTSGSIIVNYYRDFDF